MAKTVQILIPDTIDEPMGGMGEQMGHVLDAFPPGGFRFQVIGPESQEATEYPWGEYCGAPYLRPEVGQEDPLAKIMLMQSSFISASMTRKKPDIIHCMDWSTFYAGMILAETYQIPLVVSIHLSIEKMIEQPHIIQAALHNQACGIEFTGMQRADLIIQVSKSYAREFPRLFMNKTVVIENGIDVESWTRHMLNTFPARELSKLPGSRPLKLAYIGRFATMKNVLSILEANIPQNVDVLFIGGSKGGDGGIQDQVIQAAKDRDEIHYLGPKYGDEKKDTLLACDAMIMPSTHEPFGIVALEALASRNVLLSSFEGGMGDFLNEETAINCGTTPESITEAMEALSRMGDTEKQARIENGLGICESYSWVLQAQKLELTYTAILNQDKESTK